MPRIGTRLRIGRHVTITARYERFVGGAFFDTLDAERDAGCWALQTAFRF